MTPASPSFDLLGPLEVGGLSLGGERQRAVLGVLLLEAPRVVSAEAVAIAAWGDDATPATARSVRSYVSRLRRLLGVEALQLRPRGFLLSIDPDGVDASRFESLVEAARRARAAGDLLSASRLYADALSLWRGRVLEDVPVLSSHPRVVALEELRLLAAEEWTAVELERGEAAAVVAELEALVSVHPFRERFWEQLMLALYRSGRQAEALDAYARARAVLDEQLGLEPGPRLVELQRRILRHELEAPPVRRLRTNLPATVGTFLGRERELAELDDLLRGARLVTVTGIGGGGKTRLALEAVRAAIPRYPGGVWLVELAPLTEPDSVAAEIARVLAADGASPLEAAAARIAATDTLLVIDNAEHVQAAVAATVGELLAAAPGAHALVTSRRRLGTAGEVVYVLPPLGQDATKLFVARAQAADAGLDLDDRALAEIDEICTLVDRIPLAIELAAARVRLMTVAEIRERLAAEGVLGWPGGATAQRHRSLRNALAWSYELLSPRGRAAFRHLSIFAASFTTTAAAAVAPTRSHNESFASIAELVDASLLVAERGVPTRYRMLDTVRAYGRDLLRRAGEADELAAAHASHCLALADDASTAAFAADEDVVLGRLDAEYDELRAALDWSLGGGDRSLGLRLARALIWFWPTRGHTTEGRSFLERAIAVMDDAPDELRADLLGALGTISLRLADLHDAQRLLREAATLAHAAGASLSEGRWLHNLAGVHRALGDLAGARGTASASLACKRATGDLAGSAWTVGFLADTAQYEGDLTEAQRLYEEGLTLVRKAGDPPRLVVGYTSSLAELALRRNDREHADALAREALSHAERLGERWHVAVVHATIAEAARRGGDLDRAAEHMRIAIREAWEIRELRAVVDCLDLAARIARDESDQERAALLFAAAAAIRLRRDAAPASPTDVDPAAATRALRARLGRARFDELTAAGAGLPDEEAVALALGGGRRVGEPDALRSGP